MMLKTILLFFVTALFELLGCFLPYVWIKDKSQIIYLALGIVSLAIFVWLLSLHPEANGKVYATYGGIYITSALLWLRFVDKISLTLHDYLGAFVILMGVLIILSGWNKI